MAEFKINIGDPKTKKTYKKTVSEDDAKRLLGKKIGEVIRGELIDLNGYSFKITGGSDKSGFPMKQSIHGIARKKIFMGEGVGFRNKFVKKKGEKKIKITHKGIKLRKTLAGNSIYEQTAQINLKVVKQGAKSLAEIFAPKEEKTETNEKSE